jgi:hypothetical protein
MCCGRAATIKTVREKLRLSKSCTPKGYENKAGSRREAETTGTDSVIICNPKLTR